MLFIADKVFWYLSAGSFGSVESVQCFGFFFFFLARNCFNLTAIVNSFLAAAGCCFLPINPATTQQGDKFRKKSANTVKHLAAAELVSPFALIRVTDIPTNEW